MSPLETFDAPAAARSEPPLGRALSPQDRTARLASRISLYAALFALGAGQSFAFTVIPPLARSLGLPDIAAGTFIGLSALLWALTSPFWGRVSQQVGRKPVIVSGVFALLLSTAVLAVVGWIGREGFMTGWWLFLALALGRSIYGIFGSATPPSAQAYIADRTEGRERATELARLAAAFGAGSTAAPSVLGPSSLFAWWGPFAVTGLVALLCVLLVSVLMKERHEPPRISDTPQHSRLRLRDRRVRGSLAVGLGVGAVLAIDFSILVFQFLDRSGLDEELALLAAQWAWVTTGLAGLLAQLVVVPVFRPGAHRMAIYGIAVMMVGQSLIFLAPGMWTLLAGFSCVGFGFGLARPGFTAAASLVVNDNEQGAIAGLVSGVAGFAFIAGPVLGSGLHSIETHLPLVASLIILAGAMHVALTDPAMRATRSMEYG